MIWWWISYRIRAENVGDVIGWVLMKKEGSRRGGRFSCKFWHGAAVGMWCGSDFVVMNWISSPCIWYEIQRGTWVCLSIPHHGRFMPELISLDLLTILHDCAFSAYLSHGSVISSEQLVTRWTSTWVTWNPMVNLYIGWNWVSSFVQLWNLLVANCYNTSSKQRLARIPRAHSNSGAL